MQEKTYCNKYSILALPSYQQDKLRRTKCVRASGNSILRMGHWGRGDRRRWRCRPSPARSAAGCRHSHSPGFPWQQYTFDSLSRWDAAWVFNPGRFCPQVRIQISWKTDPDLTLKKKNRIRIQPRLNIFFCFSLAIYYDKNFVKGQIIGKTHIQAFWLQPLFLLILNNNYQRC